jgi:Flp pilus assembly protein TadG
MPVSLPRFLKAPQALAERDAGAARQRRAARFFADRRAATAVEFALIAAPLLLTIMEVLQTALYVYFSGQLNHATQVAARQILTGSIQNAATSASDFQTKILCPLLPSVMSCNNVFVNVYAFSEGTTIPSGFNNFVSGSPPSIKIPSLTSTGIFCPGMPQQPGSGQQSPQYVYVQVLYAMPLFGSVWLPVTTTTYNGKTVKVISSSAAFRNEPFIQTSTTPYSTAYPSC